MIRFKDCQVGVEVSITTDNGRLEATIYPPNSISESDKHRICFGKADGEFIHFKEMTSDSQSMEIAESMIRRIARGELKQSDGFITTQKGMTGYFAVHLKTSADGFEYPQSSGHERYKTLKGAQSDALKWGEADGFPVYLKRSPV